MFATVRELTIAGRAWLAHAGSHSSTIPLMWYRPVSADRPGGSLTNWIKRPGLAEHELPPLDRSS